MSDFNINEDAQGEFSGSQSSNNESDANRKTDSAFPDEDEDTITMLDVIEREDKLEEEASAVLGNSDEKNCTYPKGYISRQAIYSCATCSDRSDKVAAICLACSLECHDNHEVYELYTKRNYRCDCGNSKFKPDFECKLMDKQQKKAPLNENNKYNHNFSGRYCSCDKRYPPDETDNSAESHDEMWQCIVCEDWYHSKHLGVKDLPTKFEEMICGGCVERLDFVHYYRNLNQTDESSITNGNNDCEAQCSSEFVNEESKLTVQDNASTSQSKPDDEKSSESPNGSKKLDNGNIPERTGAVCESDTNDSQVENKDPIGETKSQVKSECTLEKLKCDGDAAKVRTKTPIFWSDCSWRSNLCRCQKCIEMYKVKECEYLLNEEDTVQYYEAQGKAIAKTRASPFERGMTALNQMNRAAVVEALHGYDELKTDLSQYLRKFAESKKVVREEDIHEFFQQLRSKKKPRLEYE